MVTIEPSDMELQKAEIEREMREAEEEVAKLKAAEEKAKKGRKARGLRSDSSEEDGESKKENVEGDEISALSAQDAMDDVEDDEEEYSYRVFFRKEEIRMTAEMQQKDQFADLLSMRTLATAEQTKNMGMSQKFNILDYSPKKGSLDSDRSRLRMRKVKSKGVSTGLDLGSLQSGIDEDDESNEEDGFDI